MSAGARLMAMAPDRTDRDGRCRPARAGRLGLPHPGDGRPRGLHPRSRQRARGRWRAHPDEAERDRAGRGRARRRAGARPGRAPGSSGAGPIHLEYVLHTEIYKARPDVGAVVHTHPPYATAFGATDATLELLNHDAVLFRDGLAYFDDTAELIVRPEQGAAVAAALGDKRVLVMRGHGVHRHRRDRALGDLRRAHPGAGAADPVDRALARQPPADVRRRWPTGSTRTSTATIISPSYWDYLVRQVRRAGLDDGMPERG